MVPKQHFLLTSHDDLYQPIRSAQLSLLRLSSGVVHQRETVAPHHGRSQKGVGLCCPTRLPGLARAICLQSEKKKVSQNLFWVSVAFGFGSGFLAAFVDVLAVPYIFSMFLVCLYLCSSCIMVYILDSLVLVFSEMSTFEIRNLLSIGFKASQTISFIFSSFELPRKYSLRFSVCEFMLY